MSVNSLANAAVARRLDFFPLSVTPKSLLEIANAARTPAATRSQTTQIAAPEARSSQIDTALHVLFGYIPTEVLTLYVAILAAVQQPNKVTTADWIAFWSFLVATPIVVWLVYAAKLKASNKPLPLAFGALPVWEMVAATVAYCAWAFALPNTPFGEYSWYSSALSGVAVLVASTCLGLLAPFFQKPLNVT